MTCFVLLGYLACASLVAGEAISNNACTPGTQGSCQTQDASVLLQGVSQHHSVDSEDGEENHDDEGATRALLNARGSTQEQGCPFGWEDMLCKCSERIDACRRVANGECRARSNCKKKVKKCSSGGYPASGVPGVCRRKCKDKINNSPCYLLTELDGNVSVTEASNRSVEDEEDQDDEEHLDLGLDDEGDQKSMDETISDKRTC